MEEGTELLGRLQKHLDGDESVKLPILTSCCPGWVNFFESNFPDMLDVPSTAKSPQQMFGAIAKSYLAEANGNQTRGYGCGFYYAHVWLKKYESQRPEFAVDGNPDVDFSITNP